MKMYAARMIEELGRDGFNTCGLLHNSQKLLMLFSGFFAYATAWETSLGTRLFSHGGIVWKSAHMCVVLSLTP